MIRFINKIMCVVTLIALHTSCKHDHLHYAIIEKATIEVEIDWSEAHVTPNGVTPVAYNSDGTLYAKFATQSAERPVEIALPKGKFDIVFYNNNQVEHPNVSFENIDDINNFIIRSNTKDPIRDREPEDADRDLISDPSVIASAILSDVEITDEDIKVFYDQPDNNSSYVVQKHKIYAERDVVTYVLSAHITDIRYAAGAPRTFFKHDNIGHYMGLDKDVQGKIMHEFVLNNRHYDDDTQHSGTVRHEFRSYGKLPCDYTNIFVDMDFILLDGTHHRVVVNATDMVEIKKDDDGIIKYFIHLEFALPEATGDIGVDSGFDVGAEEWTDVEVTLPI